MSDWVATTDVESQTKIFQDLADVIDNILKQVTTGPVKDLADLISFVYNISWQCGKKCY